MLKVGEIYYSGILHVTDSDGVAVTTLVNADFTKTVYKNGVVVASPTITVSHLANGNYQAQLTPSAEGMWTLIFSQATYAPDGWSENVAIRPIDADLEYTGALCTLAEIHDELNIADTDTNADDLFNRLISSVTSQILSYTRTEFISRAVVDEYHDIEAGQSRVFTNYAPIYTGATVTVYEDGTLMTYTSDPDTTEYHIQNSHIEKAAGPFSPGSRRFKISYTAFKTVPYEIKECAIQMVALMSGKKTRTYIDEQGITQSVLLTSIPKHIWDTLDRHKRIIF